MPDLKTHCEISVSRTGQTFEPLHKWMDEATKFLKYNHRLERHFFTQEYAEFIEKEWGKKAIVEWLFHIAVDNLETANKFAIDTYNKGFDKIVFHFSGEDLDMCEFIKIAPTYEKIFTYKKDRENKYNEESSTAYGK